MRKVAEQVNWRHESLTCRKSHHRRNYREMLWVTRNVGNACVKSILESCEKAILLGIKCETAYTKIFLLVTMAS